MTGLGCCMNVSKRMQYSLKPMSLRDRLDPLAATMLGQDHCDAWRAVATAVGGGLDSMSATTFSVLAMWQMSLVNSAT